MRTGPGGSGASSTAPRPWAWSSSARSRRTADRPTWPPELPRTSRNVPTFHDAEQTPATATRQTDYVFASESIADRVQATAMNAPEEWGASDHCRVSIAVDL
jgi:endonuclease/exonuclease/phosphatase family metal-dependent hydrolase